MLNSTQTTHKNMDAIEYLKIDLASFLESAWVATSVADETELWKQSNLDNSVFPRITNVDSIVWSAKGKHDTQFTLVETGCDARVGNSEMSIALPTEHLASLFVFFPQNDELSLRAKTHLRIMWHGYEFLITDKVSMNIEEAWLCPSLITYFHQIILVTGKAWL